MAAVVRAVSAHLSHRNDSHGRNALLMTYIAYQVLTSTYTHRGPTEDIIHYFTLMSSEIHYLDIIPKIENLH